MIKIGARSGLAAVLLVGLCASRSASAEDTVFGNPMAQLCWSAAHAASRNEMLSAKAIPACDAAIEDETLSIHDRAGTFVNRGVLRLAGGFPAKAKQDFESAAALMPDLGEAYTDRGAALIAMRRYADGIADIDKGLELKAEEPEKAYFNRALADEALDDMKSAYRDYMQSSQLKPDWDEPKMELTRFTISRQ
jgi:tetratricopeptide (TPR) repeat protein